MTGEAAQPPHPPAARRLRLRVPGHVRPGRLAARRARAGPRPHGAEPATRDDRRPGLARHDLRPPGHPAGDRPPGDDGLREPAADRRPGAGGRRGRSDVAPRPQGGRAPALGQVEGLRLHRAQGRCEAREAARTAEHRGARLPPRGAARLPAAARGVTGARLRRDGQPRSGRAGARPRPGPPRPAGPGDRRPRPSGPSDQHPLLDSRRAGPGRLPDHRPHAAGERRGRAAPDDPALGRGGGERRRPRSAQRRHPRDGRRARLRREPLSDRPEGPAAEPSRHGHLRAGLDVQGRDRQRGALRGTRLAFHCVHAPLRDPGRGPDDPRRARARHGADDGRRDHLQVVERGHDHAG